MFPGRLLQRIERTEMAGQHDVWRQPPQDPRPIRLREAAAGDPRQKDVHAAGRYLVVDQVGAPLMVEGRTGDLDVNPVHGAALVGRRRQGVEMLA